ncbi:hypothetical protein F4678DRAFT_454701 [Xylaria arbuscula]|nr:hypothetical protein F4678DRAFT_454701 [Xylaria arbuscula]
MAFVRFLTREKRNNYLSATAFELIHNTIITLYFGNLALSMLFSIMAEWVVCAFHSPLIRPKKFTYIYAVRDRFSFPYQSVPSVPSH